MATATFWQRGETIDRINNTAKTIPANTIQAIGKRIGVVAMEAAPGQKYSVNVVGVYSFPKKASEAITAGADVYWDNTNGVITATSPTSSQATLSQTQPQRTRSYQLRSTPK